MKRSSSSSGQAERLNAAADALGSVDYVVPLWATENRVALIEELTEHWLPDGFTQASFFCGGSESVDAAARLARTHHVSNGDHGRWKVIGRARGLLRVARCAHAQS